jgi:hypothetical protein
MLIIFLFHDIKFSTGGEIRTPIDGFGDHNSTIELHPCVVTPNGLEPLTPSLKVRCSNQLSYEVILTLLLHTNILFVSEHHFCYCGESWLRSNSSGFSVQCFYQVSFFSLCWNDKTRTYNLPRIRRMLSPLSYIPIWWTRRESNPFTLIANQVVCH